MATKKSPTDWKREAARFDGPIPDVSMPLPPNARILLHPSSRRSHDNVGERMDSMLALRQMLETRRQQRFKDLWEASDRAAGHRQAYLGGIFGGSNPQVSRTRPEPTRKTRTSSDTKGR